MPCNINNLVSIANPCAVNPAPVNSVYTEKDINGFSFAAYSAIAKDNTNGYSLLISERKKAYNSLLLALQREITEQRVIFNTQNLNRNDKKSGAFVQVFETVAAKKGVRFSRSVNSQFVKMRLEKVSVFTNVGVTTLFFTVAIVQNGEYLYLPFSKTVTANALNTFDFSNIEIISEGDIFIYFENSYSLKSANIKDYCQVCGGNSVKKPFKTENVTITNSVGEIEYTKNIASQSANGIVADVNVYCDFEAFLCQTGLYSNLAEPLLKQIEINMILARKTSAAINYFSINTSGEELRNYISYLRGEGKTVAKTYSNVHYCYKLQ